MNGWEWFTTVVAVVVLVSGIIALTRPEVDVEEDDEEDPYEDEELPPDQEEAPANDEEDEMDLEDFEITETTTFADVRKVAGSTKRLIEAYWADELSPEMETFIEDRCLPALLSRYRLE